MLDMLREHARRRAREQHTGTSTNTSSPEDIAHVIRGLEAEEALLLKLRVMDGLTLAQLGLATDRTQGAVQGRLRRILERLRNILAHEDMEDRT
jgi:DNA-directed RNA polymerase specialized sigma24 family protein